jgi:hypothetical protein
MPGCWCNTVLSRHRRGEPSSVRLRLGLRLSLSLRLDSSAMSRVRKRKARWLQWHSVAPSPSLSNCRNIKGRGGHAGRVRVCSAAPSSGRLMWLIAVHARRADDIHKQSTSPVTGQRREWRATRATAVARGRRQLQATPSASQLRAGLVSSRTRNGRSPTAVALAGWRGGRPMLPPLHGAHGPSYVVIWHITPYWLRPGYSVRRPGPP